MTTLAVTKCMFYDVVHQERTKERAMREAMETEIEEKDRQLHELLAKHSEV